MYQTDSRPIKHALTCLSEYMSPVKLFFITQHASGLPLLDLESEITNKDITHMATGIHYTWIHILVHTNVDTFMHVSWCLTDLFNVTT